MLLKVKGVNKEDDVEEEHSNEYPEDVANGINGGMPSTGEAG